MKARRQQQTRAVGYWYTAAEALITGMTTEFITADHGAGCGQARFCMVIMQRHGRIANVVIAVRENRAYAITDALQAASRMGSPCLGIICGESTDLVALIRTAPRQWTGRQLHFSASVVDAAVQPMNFEVDEGHTTPAEAHPYGICQQQCWVLLVF